MQLYEQETIGGKEALDLLYKQFTKYTERPDKYIFLRWLYFMSIDLHCQLASDHFREVLPVIYTPTVGHMITNYCELIPKKDDPTESQRGLIIRYQSPPENAVDEHQVLRHHMAYIDKFFHFIR